MVFVLTFLCGSHQIHGAWYFHIESKHSDELAWGITKQLEDFFRSIVLGDERTSPYSGSGHSLKTDNTNEENRSTTESNTKTKKENSWDIFFLFKYIKENFVGGSLGLYDRGHVLNLGMYRISKDDSKELEQDLRTITMGYHKVLKSCRFGGNAFIFNGGGRFGVATKTEDGEDSNSESQKEGSSDNNSSNKDKGWKPAIALQLSIDLNFGSDQFSGSGIILNMVTVRLWKVMPSITEFSSLADRTNMVMTFSTGLSFVM